jgi:hypothetical protein
MSFVNVAGLKWRGELRQRALRPFGRGHLDRKLSAERLAIFSNVAHRSPALIAEQVRGNCRVTGFPSETRRLRQALDLD